MYHVLSPDGFDITYDTLYATRVEAEQALAEWCKGFTHQGYYRDAKWNQIPVAELPDACTIEYETTADDIPF